MKDSVLKIWFTVLLLAAAFVLSSMMTACSDMEGTEANSSRYAGGASIEAGVYENEHDSSVTVTVTGLGGGYYRAERSWLKGNTFIIRATELVDGTILMFTNRDTEIGVYTPLNVVKAEKPVIVYRYDYPDKSYYGQRFIYKN